MEPTTMAGDRSTGTAQIDHSELALEEVTTEHPEVLAWFTEAKRLFAEAEERLKTGEVLPALSSLVAVPPLHHMLVERCSELLHADDEAPEVPESVPPSGMYL
jgi:hypothetical protein